MCNKEIILTEDFYCIRPAEWSTWAANHEGDVYNTEWGGKCETLGKEALQRTSLNIKMWGVEGIRMHAIKSVISHERPQPAGEMS